MASRADLPSTREGALRWYEYMTGYAAKLGPDQVYRLRRWLCRNDLFYLLVIVCKRQDINHDWLFARCREVELNPNGHLDLWAREHYKSTIITFGLSIQDVLASHGEDPEPRYNRREVTIGILSFNRPSAKAFLKQIKQELETNEDLQGLFPDILYSGSTAEIQRAAQKWSEDEGLIVKRKANPKEATIEAYGLVDGQPTGKHYLIRVYDDIVTVNTVTNAEMILKTTDAWALSTNLGTEGGWARYAGTRYALADTYAVMMERGVPARQHACTIDGSEDWSKSVLRSAEFLEDRRREQGPYVFGAQMLLNPTADRSQGFRREWLRYWAAASAAGLNVYLIVDPASKKKKSNDFTTMWVVGVGGDKNYYVLDGIRDRLNLVERQRALFMLHRKWRPLAVGYEEYGLQADIEHHQYVMKEQNYRFDITTLGGQIAKEDRIKRLIPKFESGRVYLPENGIVRTNHQGVSVDIIRQLIAEEYEAFPVVTHDDGLDCLARILDPEMPVMFPTPPPPAGPKWMQEHLAQEAGRGWETE